jgi:hypothetical protein
MRVVAKLLPTEVAALVHHVELNRAGWWEKAVHRLVLAAIWLADKPPTVGDIQATLKNEFRLVLNESKVTAAIQTLESQNALVRLDGPVFRIPDDRRAVFEAEIKDAENAAARAREYFCALVRDMRVELNPDSTWQVFESEFLAPLIKEVGASAYRLIAGEPMIADKRLVRRFLERFDDKLHPPLNELVSRFLDPKKDEVRTYVSRLLHATFCVEASGLPENVLQKLNSSGGKQITFRVFVDTNFLFSILALHENPSNSAARDLQDLIGTLKGNPMVALFVTPRTIDEAKHSISLAKGQLAGVPAGMNFTVAALRVGLSGMAERFLEERRRTQGKLTPDEWFDPYLNNFVSIARGKGVELFNEKLDGYTTRQDVVDDILLVMKVEERRESRRKTYEMIQHDMVLWHLVDDKRPAYIESPVDAKDWILTVDFRLIGFDEHKQKQSGAKVPICLHPTSLIQLLQFWVPRTKEFEEAILGSIRLPFLFQEFDADAERLSLRILRGIGRFENSEHLPEGAITDVVLDEGLRARIKTEKNEEAEIALIRDALLEEMKARADAESNRVQELHDALMHRDAKISVLDAETKGKDEALEQLRSRIAEEEIKAAQAQARIRTQGKEIEELSKKWQHQEDLARRRRALGGYMVLLFTVVAASCGAAWWIAGRMPLVPSLIGIGATRVLIGINAFILCHLCLEWSVRRRKPMNQLWPFQQVSKFRGWLWSIVIICFVLGVIENLVANHIQEKLDSQKLIHTAPPAENRPN